MSARLENVFTMGFCIIGCHFVSMWFLLLLLNLNTCDGRPSSHL